MSIPEKFIHGLAPTSERGFVVTPITIAIASIILIGTVWATYEVNREKESSNHEEIMSMAEATPTPTPDISEQDALPSPSSDPSPAPSASPAIKAATTSEPTQPTPQPELDIPLIVEEEFEKVFGRKPTNSESNYWKERYRNNSADRTKIRAWMQSDKEKEKTVAEVLATPAPTPANAPSVIEELVNCAETDQASGGTGQGCFAAYGTLYGSGSYSNGLKKYIVENEISFDEFIIREYPYGQQYFIEKGIGCLSLSFQTIRPFYIEQSGFLDGIGDKIIIPDRGQSCRIWDAKAL